MLKVQLIKKGPCILLDRLTYIKSKIEDVAWLLYDVSDCCISALGHLILDEDLERTTFIVGTGLIGPMDIVSVIISTTLELPTLENGAIRIIYPTLLTPIVTGQMTTSKSESGGKSEETGYLCSKQLWQSCVIQ